MSKKKSKTYEKDYSDGLLDRLLAFVEKDRVGLLGALAILLLLGFLRSVGECALFGYPSTTIYLRAVHEALYLALFTTGAFLVTWVSGVSGRKIFNVMLFGWWIILIPPIVDYFLGYGKTGAGYPYPHDPNPIKWISEFFSVAYIKAIGIGEMLQLWLVIILPGIYVGLKKRSLIRGFLSSLSIFLFIVYIVTAMNFIKDIKTINGSAYVVLFHTFYIPIYTEYYSGLTNLQAAFLIQQQVYIFIVFYYTSMFLMSSLLFMYVYSRERARAFLHSVKWKRMGAVLASVSLGFAVPRLMLYYGLISYCPIYPEYALHSAYVGIAAISVLAAAQVWNMLEDLSSDDWDYPYTRKQYRNLALAFSLLSLSLAYLLGYGPMLIVATFMILGYAYSSEYFDIAHTRLAPLALATYAVIPFLMAYYTPSYWLIKIWGPDYSTIDHSMMAEIRVPVSHPLYPEIAAIAIAIYAVSLFIIMRIKKNE